MDNEKYEWKEWDPGQARLPPLPHKQWLFIYGAPSIIPLELLLISISLNNKSFQLVYYLRASYSFI